MPLSPKILVADDDQALSRTLSWILKENGYDVLTVPGGEHLFDHLEAEPLNHPGLPFQAPLLLLIKGCYR